MSYYVEKRLVDVHKRICKHKIMESVFSSSLAYLSVLSIPFIHLGLLYKMWADGKPAVDQHHCTCSCFDTIYRGKYEWPPSTYKHFYFNTTINTFAIFAIFVLATISCYETVKYLVSLVRLKTFRSSFYFLFTSSIYSHYYGVWNCFQYLNEDFYSQWNHQMFFSSTELLSTVVVVHLCNSHNKIKWWKLLLVLCVSLVHVLVACMDQFVFNVVVRNGQDFEIMRDIGLTTGDIAHIVVCVVHVYNNLKLHKVYKEEVLLFVLAVVLLSVLGRAL